MSIHPSSLWPSKHYIYKMIYGSGGSSIGCIRRTPPLIGENIAFSCIFWNKVKLTPLFQPKCGLRLLLLHILDTPLYVMFVAGVASDKKIGIFLSVDHFKEKNN